MQKKYQVFVSSTYEDLKDERKEAFQAILEAKCIPSGMELFPASNKTQWDFITKVIDECDFYLLILAGKYGSTFKNAQGKELGYTEAEYNYAVDIGKPIIALIYDNIDNLPKSKSETTATKNRMLEEFRKTVLTGRLIRKWRNKEDLRANIIAALNGIASDNPAVGWVRSTVVVAEDQLRDDLAARAKQIAVLNKEKRDLLNRIEEVCQEAQYWRGESERMRKMLMRCSMNGIDDEIAEELEMMAIADVRMQDFLSE